MNDRSDVVSEGLSRRSHRIGAAKERLKPDEGSKSVAIDG